jgi:hypothetical protein
MCILRILCMASVRSLRVRHRLEINGCIWLLCASDWWLLIIYNSLCLLSLLGSLGVSLPFRYSPRPLTIYMDLLLLRCPVELFAAILDIILHIWIIVHARNHLILLNRIIRRFLVLLLLWVVHLLVADSHSSSKLRVLHWCIPIGARIVQIVTIIPL